ncbi:MAG: hypothetical protein ACRD4O_13030 [Bryobacteraceae bacterium]
MPGSGTATLTITAGSTAAGPGDIQRHGFLHGGPGLPILAALAGFTMVLFLLWPRKRARMAAIALAGLSLAAVSCGGGNSSNPTPMALQSVAESGIVTVTATAGVMTQTANLSVIVQ